MNYGQEGSVAESPSGYNLNAFLTRVPYSTGALVNETGNYIFSDNVGSFSPMEKLIIMNSAPTSKNVVWVGINAPDSGASYMSTGVGIPLSGGLSIEFGGPSVASVRNAWAVTAPGQTQYVNVYGQYSDAGAL
jgi:hypothetical protein